MYRVKDVFTTRDGNMDPNGDPREYGISKEMMEKYGHEIEDKGCATCIFVKLEGGVSDTVFFFTNGGHSEEHKVRQDRWAQTNMYNPGSGYNPDNKEGPWSVHAKDAASDIYGGIGLPYGWHVSTFVVLEWEEGADGGNGETGEGPEEPEEPEGLDKYPIYITFDIMGESYEGYVRKI